MFSVRRFALAGLILLTIVCGNAYAADELRLDFNIESQPLADALAAFGKQAKFDVVYSIAPKSSLRLAPAVIGRFTVREALSRLLKGSGGEYVQVADDMIVFRIPDLPDAKRIISTVLVRGNDEIPEVFIHASKSQNADILRSRDDAEPYVVFTRQDIELSQATDVVSFLATRLPELSSSAGGGGQADVLGTSRTLDLRGLGQNQTLVLLDGRRMAGASYGGDSLQPDLSVVPLEKIERIEVLPTTASARYGGGATAGVINIVLRRGDPGTQFSVEAEHLAGIDARYQHIYIGHTSELPDERGSVSVWASYTGQSPVRTEQWDLVTPGRERVLENNPNAFAAAPPLSDLTNVRSLDGSPLFDDRPGDHLFIPANFDSRRESIDVLKANLGQFRLALSPSAQLQGGALASLRARSDVGSLSATGYYRLSDSISTDFDLRFAETVRSALASGAEYGNFRGAILPANSPTNPFGKDLAVSVPIGFADGLFTNHNRLGRAAGALQTHLPHEWVARLEYGWSFSAVTLTRPMLQVDPAVIADGQLNLFEGPITADSFPYVQSTLKTSNVRTEIAEASLRIAGKVFATPAGDAQMTVLLEQRDERLAKGASAEYLIAADGSSTFQDLLPEQKERIDSVYTELRLPLLMPVEDGRQSLLETQLSARIDRYRANTALYSGNDLSLADSISRSTSTFSAASWMSSVKFQPMPQLFLRAHCGTGFLPPSVSDLALPTVQVIQSPGLLDPKRGGEPIGAVTVVAGGNPSLEPERSRSCGAGLVAGPLQGTGLRFSADFTRIRKSQVIYSPTEWLFTDPTSFFTRLPERVTRGAPASNDRYNAGPITRIDASSLNLSSNEVKSWDFSLGYTAANTRFGTLRFSTLMTLQPEFVSRLTNDSPQLNDAGIGTLAPPRYRISSSLTLERGSWLFGWSGRYIPHYIVSRDDTILLNQGQPHVAAQQYHDVYASYTLPRQSSWNGTARVQFGARNLFQHKPPFDAAAVNYFSRYGETEMPSVYLLIRADF